MNTVVKIGLFAALAGIAIWGYHEAKKAIQNFSVEVVAYGKPALRNFVLTIPLQLRFNNPSPIPIAVDKIYAEIFVLKNNNYVKGAIINQGITIPAGQSTDTIYPEVQLQNLFGGNLIETTAFVTNLLTTKEVTIRIDYTPVFQGISLPTQSFTETVPMS